MEGAQLPGINVGCETLAGTSIRYLFNWVIQHGTKKTVDAGEVLFETNASSILAIETGAWRLLMGEHKVIRIIGSGGIISLDYHPAPPRNQLRRYEVVSRSTYYELPMKNIHLAASDKELFNGLFEFMAWNARNISKKWLMQCMGDSYTEVKSALEWMSVLPASIRTKFTVITFITDTTGVSRSHALSIMKSLKQGGYIKMDGGYLSCINRKLPDKY